MSTAHRLIGPLFATAVFTVLLTGCGATKTVTVTVRHTITNVQTTTVTRTIVKQAPVAIYVPALDAPPQYKPPEIGISVDSGNQWVIKRWISYGGDTAKAIATTHINDCMPNCAEGHETNATTTLLFSERIACKGVPAYSGFEVIQSSDEKVASVGEEQDLSLLC